ncbi:GNAT family N-acetyltransferase [Pelosinus sp. sgz500959]|uniref:GNAT family N-acetyltransferase n=1 Tax=Pelosinus sp. sgz500959 TaxID=3242472 RepID=UPI0036733949
MCYRIQENIDNIDWQEVCKVLREAGLTTHSTELTRKAFKNSYRVVFVFDNELLIGVGRAISDGAYQAAIYDIAVLPSYQGKKIGKLIVDEIHKGLQEINIILYASLGKEAFYNKIGYNKMLTGMAKFKNQNIMREKGFID